MIADGLELGAPPGQSTTLQRGILTNLLNPHPYLFWFGVGAPLMAKASAISFAAPVAFISSFYDSILFVSIR